MVMCGLDPDAQQRLRVGECLRHALDVLLDRESREGLRSLAEMMEEAEELYWTAVALRQDAEWRQAGKPQVALPDLPREKDSEDGG
jgi:hypothetical protein